MPLAEINESESEDDDDDEASEHDPIEPLHNRGEWPIRERGSAQERFNESKPEFYTLWERNRAVRYAEQDVDYPPARPDEVDVDGTKGDSGWLCVVASRKDVLHGTVNCLLSLQLLY